MTVTPFLSKVDIRLIAYENLMATVAYADG